MIISMKLPHGSVPFKHSVVIYSSFMLNLVSAVLTWGTKQLRAVRQWSLAPVEEGRVLDSVQLIKPVCGAGPQVCCKMCAEGVGVARWAVAMATGGARPAVNHSATA